LIKNVVFAIFQFVLFLLVFALGSFLPPFHLRHVLSVTPDGTRVFIWDGLLLSALLFVLILLIEAARKRIVPAALWTTAAFVLSTVAGLAAKLGFLTQPPG
jgi:hypothetical protein